MHSKVNAQISGKKDQKSCFWHGMLTAHPWFFGEPIPEIAMNQGTIDVFSALCKIASGRLIAVRYSGVWGAGLHPRSRIMGNYASFALSHMCE
jgi:hypothetical protein